MEKENIKTLWGGGANSHQIAHSVVNFGGKFKTDFPNKKQIIFTLANLFKKQYCVMLNLFQHLISPKPKQKTNTDKTLKQVQGDSSHQIAHSVVNFGGGLTLNFPNKEQSVFTLAKLKSLFKKLISNATAFDGFTLAEVLITLAIIGVVASLTIPSVIVKYQKEQTVIKLKKVYTELSNAINQSSIVNGTSDKWDYTLPSKDFFDRYLKDYLSVTKVCPDNKTAKQCFGIDYFKIDGKTSANSMLALQTNSYKVVLKDGAILYIRPYYASSSDARSFTFDINGIKKPNIYGIDLFAFSVLKSSAGLNTGDLADRSYYLKECKKDGSTCATLILKDGWQIKDDYPWR